MLSWRIATGLLVLLCISAAPSVAWAQDDADKAVEAEMISINLPENTNLKVLTDWIGPRLGMNLIYDNQLAGRMVSIKAPNKVPADSLRELWESILKINGLALVEQEGVPGMVRITTATGALNKIAVGPFKEGEEPPKGGATQVVSRIYKLKHVSPDQIDGVVGPFINAAEGASIIKLPRNDMVIITDFASNRERIEQMLAIADQPGRAMKTIFVQIEHLVASELLEQLNKLIEAQAAVQGDDPKSKRFALIADDRTNKLVIAARPTDSDSIKELVSSLDVSLGLVTEVYRTSVVSPAQIDEVTIELIGENKANRLYKSVIDEDNGLLVATTTQEIHKQIVALIEKMDAPLPEAQSPIRFYKLQNASALTVAEALSGISGEEGLGSVSVDGIDSLQRPGFGQSPVRPAGDQGSTTPNQRTGEGVATSDALPDTRILAYEPTNTIIVIAPPGLQPIYEKLIKKLDARRPQVLVEATIVALDTTDDFSLGVEFSSNEDADGGTLLNFTQFGLSTVDPDTGELTLNPGIGFNGALLDADVAEIVIRALKTDTNSSVLTRPSVLVNDNAEGELESKDTEPFESVNANNQVATTSFAGELEAGTTILVKPSISEGDFLKLEYSIKVSSFVGERTETSTGGTLPPARTENNIKSSVTIPDGSTIVVGGLTREIDSETIRRVPLLGQIPIVKHAFSDRSSSKRQITIFVFLRPIILRDDAFEDLKVLSGAAAGRAQLPSDFPSALPVEIR